MKNILKTSTTISTEHLKDWLKNWSLLSMKLAEWDLTEDDLLCLMKYELQGKNREQIINRLYSRFSTIRRDRERRELRDVRKRCRKLLVPTS